MKTNPGKNNPFTISEQRRQLWDQCVAAVTQELHRLPAAERRWLDQQLAKIADLQRRIQAVCEQGAGVEACRSCRGACCGHGSFHLTLVNLLGYLAGGEEPFRPDFVAGCPYLGATGCRIPVPWRPFNCVTFICEAIEERLTAAQVAEFYRLEAELRRAYDAFDRRYCGSSQRGLLQSANRLGGRGFLQRR